MNLKNFFWPRAVAVVGASSDRQKIGRQILDNLIKGGFSGPIYPINLKEKRLANRRAYPSLEVLPRLARRSLLVVIAIPAPLVLTELEKCGRLGLKNIIIITAGFKESGASGAVLEKQVVQIAEKYQLNILGPNCLGLINTKHRLNATFAAADKEVGNIALLSQSGAIGSAALDWLKEKDFNFAYFISLGNKTVLSEYEIISYLAKDKHLDLIVVYLEEIKNGQRLMELLSRLGRQRPVAILKSGLSASGERLARSHTGALAGSAVAIKTSLRRAGVIWLENLEELFNLMLLFRKEAWQNQGNQDLFIITNAGGVAVLAADEISRADLKLAQSLDLLGDADAARYALALRKTLADKKVNNLLLMLTPQTSTEPLKTAQALVAASRKYPQKMIMVSFLGGAAVKDARDYLEKHNIPSFDYPEQAIRSFRQLIAYKNTFSSLEPYRTPRVKRVRAWRNPDYLKSLGLLKKYQIPLVKTYKYKSSALKTYHYPAVLKIVGPDFLHKTDQGGVIKDLISPQDLRRAAISLQHQQRQALKDPRNYLIVQKQEQKFQELIIGFKRDASFGPIILVGWGGIYAEVFKEIKLTTSDLDYARARRLIQSLKIFPVLNGARGQKKYDYQSVARILVRLARLANEHPEIKELDINPLFVKEKGVLAGDVRIIS